MTEPRRDSRNNRTQWNYQISGMDGSSLRGHAGTMKVPIGLHLTNFSFRGVGERDRLRQAVAIAVAAEEAGFDSLWVNDHLIEGQPPNQGGARPEAYVYLATVAANTSRLRLGALASSIFFRNPALLARMIVSLNDASRGRAVLGVGAGHPRTEQEHLAFGFDFPSIGERMDRLEAVLPEIRQLIGDSIPILVAGSGEHRLLRIVARYADMCNLSMPSGDTLEIVRHRLGVLAAHCSSVGRDFTSITKTYKAMLQQHVDTDIDFRQGRFGGDRIGEGAQAFVDAGIDEVIVQIEDGENLDNVRSAAKALAGLTPRPSAKLSAISKAASPFGQRQSTKA